MMSLKRFAILFAALLAAVLVAGCMGRVITEDQVQLNLPDIDPEDGVEKTVPVTLYYRLTNEKYLVSVNRSVSVRASERTETAVIRALIEGVPLLATDVSPLFPEGTSVVEVTFDGGILYVTLSKEFMSTDTVNSVARENYLSDEDYKKALAEAAEEMYLLRRLGVLSIVNTIAGNSEGVKVQFMVDTLGDGSGKRLLCEELGFEEKAGEIMEPMGFYEEAVATPQRVAGCLLEHMVKGEYEMAYPLIAESDYTGAMKPMYADFETEMMTLGRMESYEVTGIYNDQNGIHAVVDVRKVSPSGTIKRVSNAMLILEDEGDLHKVGYGSLKKLMES